MLESTSQPSWVSNYQDPCPLSLCESQDFMFRQSPQERGDPRQDPVRGRQRES